MPRCRPCGARRGYGADTAPAGIRAAACLCHGRGAGRSPGGGAAVGRALSVRRRAEGLRRRDCRAGARALHQRNRQRVARQRRYRYRRRIGRVAGRAVGAMAGCGRAAEVDAGIVETDAPVEPAGRSRRRRPVATGRRIRESIRVDGGLHKLVGTGARHRLPAVLQVTAITAQAGAARPQADELANCRHHPILGVRKAPAALKRVAAARASSKRYCEASPLQVFPVHFCPRLQRARTRPVASSQAMLPSLLAQKGEACITATHKPTINARSHCHRFIAAPPHPLT